MLGACGDVPQTEISAVLTRRPVTEQATRDFHNKEPAREAQDLPEGFGSSGRRHSRTRVRSQASARGDARVEDRPDHGDQKHLSLLLRLVRRHHPHAWRQVEERQAIRGARRGRPRPPINRGTLCPKGITLREDIVSSSRLTTPQVRRPGSDKWEPISWDKAIGEIARQIK